MNAISFFTRIGMGWATLGSRNNQFEQQLRQPKGAGSVFLVGAGPGDPELLTVKAQRILQEVDVVMHDWLVSSQMLELIPKKTRKVFVGKRAGQHSMTQREICSMLVEYANKGFSVARLKGGDPSIFGRINEEAQALEEANIDYCIVPGITSACAAAAYTGIPLTARNIAQSVSFVTAQFADPNRQPDWQQYQTDTQNPSQTLVVYMGLSKLTHLCRGLTQVGWQEETPIALVDQVSTRNQKVMIGTLATIESQFEASPMHGPTLIIVGKVVSKRLQINLGMLGVKATHV